MNKFIKLSSALIDNRSIYINVDNIQTLEYNNKTRDVPHTIINFNDGQVRVLETPEQILELIYPSSNFHTLNFPESRQEDNKNL